MNTRKEFRTRWRASLVAMFLGSLFGACSSHTPGSLDVGFPQGTPTSDGAPGVCCPPSTGLCVKKCGYNEQGICDEAAICDNPCEQQIVDDVHGCKKLGPKAPSAGATDAGACGALISNGDASSDGRTSAAPSVPIEAGADSCNRPTPQQITECMNTQRCPGNTCVFRKGKLSCVISCAMGASSGDGGADADGGATSPQGTCPSGMLCSGLSDDGCTRVCQAK
jgi:hypothetical protein